MLKRFESGVHSSGDTDLIILGANPSWPGLFDVSRLRHNDSTSFGVVGLRNKEFSELCT